MSKTMTFILFAAVLCALSVILTEYKTGHFIKSLLLSALSGIGALFAVNILTFLTGVSIAVNYLTLFISGIFGISGVIALLMI